MFIDYISYFEDSVKECEKFKKRILNIYFDSGRKEKPLRHFCLLSGYQERFIPIKKCVQLCRILKLSVFEGHDSSLYEAASDLEDYREMVDLKSFEVNINVVISEFGVAEDEIAVFCSAFDEEEKERINEAIHNNIEGCNYSCVAMSVSAVESRLLKLMCLANPDSEGDLEKKTLGQLIVEYTDNKNKYKNVVPRKHEYLLGLCNTYRTFSVHPKKQKITGRIASSIFNLAIEFLTDPDTKPEAVKVLLAASEEAK